MAVPAMRRRTTQMTAACHYRSRPELARRLEERRKDLVAG
jgi:hypothetical protein